MLLNNLIYKITKVVSDANYRNMYGIAASKCNYEAFAEIKGCNIGKEVVICGAGPTLQKYKPIDGAFHIALNRALLYDRVKFDWFMANDWDGVDFFQDELKKYECTKFFGHSIGSYEREIPESFRIDCGAKRYYTDLFMVGDGFQSRFICDIDKMAIGNMPNMGLQSMQIALFTYPKRIYIVGCDTSQGHFVQPDALDTKRIEKQEKDLASAIASDKVIKKWHELKEFANTFYPNVEIVSVNPVGLKGIFKDIYM